MPCFNYGSSSPTYVQSFIGSAGVELIYNASGTTYSFSSISRLCFFPNKDQIKVWKKLSPGSPEVAQVYSDTILADGYYRIVNENVILGVAAASGEVIIRRATPNTEMFVNFTDGAKLTAEQLNLCFAQLLFIAQEKEFIGNINNHFYPIANSYTVWSAGTSYTLNSYVSYAQNFTDGFGNTYSVNKIYKCIAPTTPGIVPTNGAYWEPVSYTTNGFIIEGAPLSVPIVFDLSNVTVNHGLIWNGGKFVAGYLGGGTLDSLSDVQITTPADKQLLQYDNATQLWKNITLPLKFVSPNDKTLFQGRAYYDNASANLSANTSFTEDGVTAAVAAPASLNAFKSGNNWVIPNIPTVYHVIKKLIPSETNPETFFVNTQNTINEVTNNLGNPVRIKFMWNMRPGRLDLDYTAPGTGNLDSAASLYWDRPEELYNSQMYTNIVSNTYYHGIENGGFLYRTNPYYASKLNATGPAAISFESKIHGYGLTSQGFYLNVPECYTSSLARVPIFNTEGVGEDDYTFTTTSHINSDPVSTGRYTELNTGNYLDTYLEAIRDMVTASIGKETFSSIAVGDNKRRDWAARYTKGLFFNAVYQLDADVSYKRLERSTESLKSCLFKIPKNIIYYNKYAMAFAYNDTENRVLNSANSAFVNNNGDVTGLSRNIRFTGTGLFNTNTTTQSTTASDTQGLLLKSNSFWEQWCRRWAIDANANQNQLFNEADIDWLFVNLSDISNINTLTPAFINFYGNSANNNYEIESYGINNQSTVAGALGTTNWRNANNYFPWAYRPNNINNGQVGTHFFNIDYNKVFSEAHNFVADPFDEYVFRLVANSAKTNSFKDLVNSSTLKSSIILEYGFTDNDNAFKPTAISLGKEVYKKYKSNTKSKASAAKLDKTKVHVYIQDERIESFGGVGVAEHYVITFCIRVPRAKSIGYSKVFRKMINSTLTPFTTPYYFPEPGSTDRDTDKDSGPWNTGFDHEAVAAGTNPPTSTITADGVILETESLINPEGSVSIISGVDALIRSSKYQISGRNECAVKFTRIGIPSDMWIKISVLNSDATASLLTGDALSASWNILAP